MTSNETKEIKELLQNGGVMLCKADTVWGLCCDATNEKAIQKIHEIKNRPAGKSYIVLVSSVAMLERYVRQVPDVAYDILDNAVNPITIVYPGGMHLPEGVVHSDGTVAIRVIQNTGVQRIIDQLRRPVVSTSANLSGQKTPVTQEDLDPKIVESVDKLVDLSDSNSGQKQSSSILKIGLNGEIEIIRK